jgi:hypothetical protein
MNILRVRDTKILNFKSAQSLLSTFFVCAARALLCEWRLEFGGALAYCTYGQDKIIRFSIAPGDLQSKGYRTAFQMEKK